MHVEKGEKNDFEERGREEGVSERGGRVTNEAGEELATKKTRSSLRGEKEVTRKKVEGRESSSTRTKGRR